MKKIILITFCLLASASFAADTNTLANLWKTKPSVHHKKDSHDITIVYGGADVSDKATLLTYTTNA